MRRDSTAYWRTKAVQRMRLECPQLKGAVRPLAFAQRSSDGFCGISSIHLRSELLSSVQTRVYKLRAPMGDNPVELSLRLGKTLILTSPETEQLAAQLPNGWSDPVYAALKRGEWLEPWDVRTLFDITLRDALDEAIVAAWQPSEDDWEEPPVGSNWELIETGLSRIFAAWPQTDVTIAGDEEGPLAPHHWEILQGTRAEFLVGLDDTADLLAAAGLWAQSLATKQAISSELAKAVWRDHKGALANGIPSGLKESSTEVALANLLDALFEVFDRIHPKITREEDSGVS